MPSASFAPFRYRSFVLIWSGALVSNVGTWMETTALSYYVADTSKAAWSGLVAAAGFLPSALLSPISGAWADRFDRKRMIMVANAASAIVAAGIAILVGTGRATPLLLALLSLLAGSAGAFGFPAFQAALPDLVPREHLVAAVGLSSTQWNLGRIIGPTLAGVAIWAGGVSAALWCNAISFVAVITAAVFAGIPASSGVQRSVRQSLRDGVRFARTNPAVRSMLPFMCLLSFVGAPFIGFVAQMATKVFHTNQSGTSFLVTAQGVGAVIAGSSMGWMSKRFGIRATMVGAVTAFVPAIIAYGLAPAIALSAIGLACVGGCYMAAMSSFSAITQQSAPSELRGRAMAVNNFVLGLGYPVGLMIQGPLADATSLRAVTVGGGVVIGAVLLAARVVRRGATEPIAAALG
jgi:MFS family permease